MGELFNWPFLDEPLYRWFVFLIAISLFLAVWHFILTHMQGGGSASA